jgi:hypothetical protein
MRIEEIRVSPAFFLAFALGYAIFYRVYPYSARGYRVSIWLPVAITTFLVFVAFYLWLHRRLFGDSALFIENLPACGQVFRGRVETHLGSMAESEFRLRIDAQKKTEIWQKSGKKFWRSEVAAHPTRGQHGLVLPVEFLIPVNISSEGITWWLHDTARAQPISYHARFVIRPEMRFSR